MSRGEHGREGKTMAQKRKAPTKSELKALLQTVSDMARRLELIARLHPSELGQLSDDELVEQDWILNPKRAEWLKDTTEAMEALKRIRALLS